MLLFQRPIHLRSLWTIERSPHLQSPNERTSSSSNPRHLPTKSQRRWKSCGGTSGEELERVGKGLRDRRQNDDIKDRQWTKSLKIAAVHSEKQYPSTVCTLHHKIAIVLKAQSSSPLLCPKSRALEQVWQQSKLSDVIRAFGVEILLEAGSASTPSGKPPSTRPTTTRTTASGSTFGYFSID